MVSRSVRSAAVCAAGAAMLVAASTGSLAQNTTTSVPRVLDVHVHAMDESFPGLGPMCPNTSALRIA